MSRRTILLPFRLASSVAPKPQTNQWVCRRCLSTQPDGTIAAASITPIAQSTVTPASSVRSSATDASSDAISSYDPTLPASKRNYPLNKTDFNLKKALPHAVPLQYLQHSTSDVLAEKEKAQREKQRLQAQINGQKDPRKNLLQGVVVSAGKMQKTVKVRIPTRRWEGRIGKYFSSHENHLVHDPASSLVAGDVVSLHRMQVSANVHHVVASIVAPFGTPIDQRAPIPTPDERLAEYKAKRFKKLARRELRRAAAAGDEAAQEKVREMDAAVDRVGKKDGRKPQVKATKGKKGGKQTN
ncbi:Hypothetical protein R9X50_00689200 [Acrodontium crateriforme]|uniref:Ribosomal protein S17 n=1 Tax=Acrodontium crateriforme TaxID=150365 RepID=A0AAQ3MAX6_9PEZI|nr:Hypothetical protein R9X50_00689200 [Acrodontium crateriforme]